MISGLSCYKERFKTSGMIFKPFGFPSTRRSKAVAILPRSGRINGSLCEDSPKLHHCLWGIQVGRIGIRGSNICSVPFMGIHVPTAFLPEALFDSCLSQRAPNLLWLKALLSKGSLCGVKGGWPFLALRPIWKQKQSPPPPHRLPQTAATAAATTTTGCGKIVLAGDLCLRTGSVLQLEPHCWHQVGIVGGRESGPSWPGVGASRDGLLSPRLHFLGGDVSLVVPLLRVSQLSLLHYSCSCSLWMTNILALLFGRTANMKNQPTIYWKSWRQNTQGRTQAWL